MSCFLDIIEPVSGMFHNVDIVFIHGLNPVNHNNHAYKTWTHGNIFWPRDLLRPHVPGARILIFGYNSNVAFGSSASGVTDHAMMLLFKYRALQLPGIPIIFVSHSLGGLVVRQALIRALNSHRLYASIKQCTTGLMFFGVPHHGGNGVRVGKVCATIARCINGSSSNDILKNLEKSSVFSREARDMFRAQQEDYMVVSFYETRKKMVRRFGICFGMNVVSKESATLGLADHRERCFPIDADHSTMCKFKFGDEGFNLVLDNMKDLIENAVAGHRTADMVLSIPHAVSSVTGIQHMTTETPTNKRISECLRSLAPVDQRMFLWNAIRTAAENSPYQWFFETKEYKQWDKSRGSSTLWISAGPGCGKTTLLANVLKRLNAIHGDMTGFGAVTLSYFFDKSNTQTESTAVSCLRTIVYQLLRQVPTLISLILEPYSSLSEKPNFTWTWDLLWSIFLNMLQKLNTLGQYSVRLIIDAIDECDDTSQPVLLKSLQYLLEDSRNGLFSGACITILISSRINFQRILASAVKFEMTSDCTESDMKAFIYTAVNDFVQKKALSSIVGEKIRCFLEQKANGMFLWVKLVLEELHRRDVRLTDDVIEAKLLNVPLQVSSIYADIMGNIRRIGRDEVWGIVRWLVFARRTLTVDDLKTALCIEYELPHWYDFVGDLQFICGSLIRIDNEEVKLVHDTAREYLSAEFERWRSMFSAEERNPHDKLAEICLHCIARDRPRRLLYTRGSFPEEPFLAYSTTAIGYHLAALSRPSPELLQLILSFFQQQHLIDLTVECYWLLENDNHMCTPLGRSRLHIAAYFNILWLIDLCLEKDGAVDFGSDSGIQDSPLIWASEMGNLIAVEKLLSAGSNPNQREGDNWTALHWAATNGHDAVAHALMLAGADRELNAANGGKPTDWAKRMGHIALATAITEFGETPREISPQIHVPTTSSSVTRLPKPRVCKASPRSGLRIFMHDNFGI